METLFLDKDGRWFHGGVEITHERTSALFSRHLVKEPDGGYCVRIGEERIRVELEDAPYVVMAVRTVEDGHGRPIEYRLLLSDGSTETLDPATLSVGTGNVLYCEIRDRTHTARFSRQAYQLLCAHIEYDEATDGYWLPWRGGRVRIACEARNDGGDAHRRTEGGTSWRECVGIEPTADAVNARRLDLKSREATSAPSTPPRKG